MVRKETIRNYEISRKDDELHIKLLSNGKDYFATYSDELYSVFTTGDFVSAVECRGYLRFRYGGISVYFHQVVYCNYYRNLNTDNCYDVITDFKAELESKKLCIDHLLCDKRNNTRQNISLMPLDYNTKKARYERTFKDVFAIVAAFDGKGYRVCFSYLNKEKYTMLFYCSTYEAIGKLYQYLSRNKWSIRKAKLGHNANNDFYTIGGKFFQRLIPKYDEPYIQQKLLDMDIEKFTKYHCNDAGNML